MSTKGSTRNSRQKQRLRDTLRRLLGSKCHYCFASLRDGVETIEHIVPLVDGGVWAIGNLVLACERCNRAMGSSRRKCDCPRCRAARFAFGRRETA